MAYVIARVELSEPGERFPQLGEELYLAAEVDVENQERQYVAQRQPYENEDGPIAFGLVDVEEGLARYAMGRARVVTLKKVSHKEARIDATAKLMRLVFDGSVNNQLQRALTTVHL